MGKAVSLRSDLLGRLFWALMTLFFVTALVVQFISRRGWLVAVEYDIFGVGFLLAAAAYLVSRLSDRRGPT